MKTQPTRELRLKLPESTVRRLEAAAARWNEAHQKASLKLSVKDITEKAIGEWLQADDHRRRAEEVDEWLREQSTGPNTGATGYAEREILDLASALAYRKTLLQNAAEVVTRETDAMERDLRILVLTVTNRFKHVEEAVMEHAQRRQKNKIPKTRRGGKSRVAKKAG